MKINRNPKTNQTYFICDYTEHHLENKKVFEDWDKPVEGQKLSLEFLSVRRKRNANYKKRNKKLGLSPKPKATIRKKWKVGRPENFKK